MTDGQILIEAIDLVERVANGEGRSLTCFNLAPTPFGRAILARVVARLHAHLDAYLFGASVRLQTEQQAMGYVRGMALELKRGSEALLRAAETLKAAGKGHQASLTYQAHKTMAAKASEVLGG